MNATSNIRALSTFYSISAFFSILALSAFAYAASGTVTANAQKLDTDKTQVTSAATVKVTAETGPGTTRKEFPLIAAALGQVEGNIRACYVKVAKSNPALEGTGTYDIVFGKGGRAAIRKQAKNADRALSKCMTKAIKKLRVKGLKPPSAVFIHVTLKSSAAKGVVETRKKSQSEAAVTFKKANDGKLKAQGGPENGTLIYELRGDASAKPAMTAAFGALRKAIPTLLDCRRRARPKAGESPRGQLFYSVKKGIIKLKSTDVTNPRALNCMKKVMKSVRKDLSRDPQVFEFSILFVRDKK